MIYDPTAGDLAPSTTTDDEFDAMLAEVVEEVAAIRQDWSLLRNNARLLIGHVHEMHDVEQEAAAIALLDELGL